MYKFHQDQSWAQNRSKCNPSGSEFRLVGIKKKLKLSSFYFIWYTFTKQYIPNLLDFNTNSNSIFSSPEPKSPGELIV